jgi:hypothetical protein
MCVLKLFYFSGGALAALAMPDFPSKAARKRAPTAAIVVQAQPKGIIPQLRGACVADRALRMLATILF